MDPLTTADSSYSSQSLMSTGRLMLPCALSKLPLTSWSCPLQDGSEAEDGDEVTSPAAAAAQPQRAGALSGTSSMSRLLQRFCAPIEPTPGPGQNARQRKKPPATRRARRTRYTMEVRTCFSWGHLVSGLCRHLPADADSRWQVVLPGTARIDPVLQAELC